MPFKKIRKNKYRSPSGRIYNAAQVRRYYARGGRFDARPARDYGRLLTLDAGARRDPTQTTRIRKGWRVDFGRRWSQVERDVRELMVEKGAFGVGSIGFGLGDRDKVQQFQQWFDAVMVTRLIGHDQGLWITPYLNRAAASAVRRAGRLVDAARAPSPSTGTLIDAATAEVWGVIEAVSQQGTRAFVDGLITRQPGRTVAAHIVDRIRKVGIERTGLLADMATVRAHANATLDVFESAGVQMVDLEPEHRHHTMETMRRISAQKIAAGDWRWFTADVTKEQKARIASRKLERVFKGKLVAVETAGDDDVCIVCEEIAEDGPYTLNEARNLIPAHPRCRCGFVPAGKA